MTDEQTVNPEQTSPEESGSTTAETQPQVETQPTEQPLTKAEVAELIAQAVDQARELGKRELQSQQDRNRAELSRATRRAQIAENIVGSARTQLKDVDPDVAKELELAELRAREQGRMTMEQEESLARQQAEFHQGFIDRQTKFLENLGIDPKDKRVDWASDAKDYLEAMERIQSSVATIQKETVSKANQEFADRLKALEAKVKADDTEANSVETSTSSGVVAGSNADFVKKFAAGEVPLTKANQSRYEKILNESQ